MLYSTIEEAWSSRPTIIESFRSGRNEECQDLIDRIRRCPGCMERLSPPLDLHAMLRAYHTPLRLTLLTVALVLIVTIIYIA